MILLMSDAANRRIVSWRFRTLRQVIDSSLLTLKIYNPGLAQTHNGYAKVLKITIYNLYRI